MFAFARTQSTRRAGSSLALAIALASGSALTAVALEAPAQAQKNKKNKKEKKQKTEYSEEFLAAYTPANELNKAEASDPAALSSGAAQVVAASTTPDDKIAGGGLVFNIGLKIDDTGLQRQGMDMMLESGKVPADKLGQYYSNAAQLAYNDDDYAAARTRFEQAIGTGYDVDNLKAIIAESYFREDRFAEGLSYLRGQIAEVVAAGQEPNESWIKRGVAVAYNNDVGAEAIRFSTLLAKHYPSSVSWGDAIAIQRTFVDHEDATILDLMRLATRTGSMRNGRDYADYIESADPRRLPGEVKGVVEAGIAAGELETSDPFVKDAQTTANERIAADRAELPSLERDARKADSTAVTATAAGDVMLSYGMAEKAEEMYTIALTKAGVDTARVMTRLGIAQIDQGKADAAVETFSKVQGKREPVAELWSIFAFQQKAPTAPAMADAADVSAS